MPDTSDQRFQQDRATEAAALLRALGNERRLLVLCLLIEHGEMAVGALSARVGLSQSALSQHLARLREDGIVCCRREAQNAFYRIADPKAELLVASLKTIFCP